MPPDPQYRPKASVLVRVRAPGELDTTRATTALGILVKTLHSRGGGRRVCHGDSGPR